MRLLLVVLLLSACGGNDVEDFTGGAIVTVHVMPTKADAIGRATRIALDGGN